MLKKKDPGAQTPVDSNQRYATSPEDRAKAKKWFQRARELGDKRQFDYAIEYYVSGLEFWPDAVEEACKPLHGCAVARRQTGGKKPGIKDTMKRSLNDKDAKKAFINALWLFGHEPENPTYIEHVARNAARLRAEDVAKWAAAIGIKALESNPKTSVKQFQATVQLLEELGDRAVERGETPFACEVYQMGVDVLHSLRARHPGDNNVDNALRDLSTKLTITKGKYKDGGESFRESIADQEAQKDLHDRQRTFQSDERMDELIEKAQAAYDANPGEPRALNELVGLLCRQEKDEYETRAIGVLVAEFKRTSEYRHKLLADDIRMKQLTRALRRAQKSGDEAAAKEAQIASLRFDLKVFKERIERYPTDNRIKFEYAVRLFNAGRFDDAIPLFQAARADPKNRTACGMYLGRCFFKKKYFPQAIAALQEEIAGYPYSDDDLAKQMNYWLGRAQEAAGDISAARETYGKILQLDYNYRDVRAKLDQLPAV
ncbi:MAG: tetratricopeptide repeat protein [Planctomycetes bacterium]|nr:tetratricopeptide repeat protein [Planctomycetota bacterium]